MYTHNTSRDRISQCAEAARHRYTVETAQWVCGSRHDSQRIGLSLRHTTAKNIIQFNICLVSFGNKHAINTSSYNRTNYTEQVIKYKIEKPVMGIQITSTLWHSL